MTHLVLFFDINGTIIALDTAQEKGREATLLQELAKGYTARWHNSLLEPITYSKFVRRHLLQGDEKSDLVLKRQRQKKYAEFLTYLELNHRDIYEQVLADFTQLQDMLSKSTGHLFPSFLYLLTELAKRKIPYTLVLRSFGDDIPAIVKELKDHSITISQAGYFKEKVLHINGQQFTDPSAIISSLRPGEHQAWRDDWPYWHTHHHDGFYGKPFYLSESDPITLFFDDKALEKDIIHCQRVDGKEMGKEEAINAGCLVPVDTLDAIRKVDYFWEKVRKFVEIS